MNRSNQFLMSDKKHNIMALIVCAAGVALNISLGLGVSATGLPLYLDTVGSVVVAVLGGYLPGVVVGFVTNIIKSFSDPSSLYYGVLNVMIAYAAAWMARRGWLKKPLGVVGMILVFTLIGGGLGSIIPWFMEGLSFDSESLSGVLYETGYFNLATSHLASSILMDLPDKTLTVILTLIIIYLVPDKLNDHFSFRWWLQAPDAESENAILDKHPVRVMSLQNKILLVLGVSLTTIAVVATATSLAIYRKTMINDHMRIATGTAEIAASVLEGDRIEEYLRLGEAAEGYAEKKQLLSNILFSSTDIAYLYVYQIREDGCHVVFDIDVGDVPGEEVGSVIAFDEGFSNFLPDLLAGKNIDPVITDDQYGYLLTAYQPVFDSEGRCVCYVGADVDMGQLLIMERSFLMEMTSVFLGFFIMLCVFVSWLIKYHVVHPVNAITKYVDEFSNAVNSQETVDEGVKSIRKIDIHTGDEVEKLYQSICRLTLNQAEQMRSIRHLSDSTTKMQDGLIITMADLVENRDSDTGAHIQKTAAYVKIIVEGLEKKGYYAEKITPKFKADVVRSAPLHDVGKICVPDEVLNKKGKLTEQEYEIIKTHTTEGRKIMEKAISTVEGESYLKEARNMAAYHHERWDGKGYPEGLHGEVIPLAARIMAVADVFDALTSPRVYKPAFPLEKALAMLQEGAGSQFDPKCIEVFMENLPEVKVIWKQYNQAT